MADLNRSLPRIDASRFSMVPRSDVPRSTFVTTHAVKSTFDADYLVPIHVDEVLPGDVHQGQVTIFARLATPLFPIMDQIEIETFFFFVPSRLLWVNWKKMMGERQNPNDSISFVLPKIDVDAFAVGSLADHLGIPVSTIDSEKFVNALPFRAYNKIYNDWFRDQNLQPSLIENTNDGPDDDEAFFLQKRNKKHDYFTSALPWPLKGGVEVAMPLSGFAFIQGIAVPTTFDPVNGAPPSSKDATGTIVSDSGLPDGSGWPAYGNFNTQDAYFRMASLTAGGAPNIRADLSTATGATINALRLAFATQSLLERDARSGTRYTELLRAHFGVMPEDMRLQRPEYIGGGRTTMQTQAIAQTSATFITGSTTHLGDLGGAATATDQHSFSYHATEHGYILGLANVRGEITYQQGLHRLWTRSTRYDFYWPVFANLGEQAIRNDEIWARGSSMGAQDTGTFGYQERWAEYRHRPSRIAGLFRSDSLNTIDPWHLSERFTQLPLLNTSFITAKTPVARVIAAGSQALNMQILWDSVFKIRTTRPMPMFSIPGMMNRF